MSCSEWKDKLLSDLGEIVSGGTPKTTEPTFWSDDISWITPKDLSGYKSKYISKGERGISEIGLKKSSAKLLPKGAVLFTSRAPIGYTAIALNDVTTNQGFKSIAVNQEHSNEFIYYLLHYIKPKIDNVAGGSTFKEVSATSFKNIEVTIPPLKTEEEKIASILSSLDNKIELNNQMNETLEEIAQTLFKRWFVDFEFPNEEGLPYKSSGGEMIPSELGEIPKGWDVVELGSISKVISKGTTPRKTDTDNAEEYPSIKFLKVKDIDQNGYINKSNLEDIPKSIHLKQLKRSILESNDILFSIAGTIGRVSLITDDLSNSNCNQALAFIRLKDVEKYIELIYLFLKDSKTQYSINSKIVQGVQANVSLKTISDLQIAIPNQELMCKWKNTISNVFYKIFENLVETESLTKTRDLLLPKLMSGEIRV